jgi:hypothetical protein
MSTRTPAIAWSIGLAVVTALVGSPAQAYMVAGWDFSQYLGPGFLSIDGVNPATTLPANYSNLDPTNNCGAESAAFGRLYYDGQFGSSVVVVDGTGTEAFVPVGGSLTSNLDAPVQGLGDNPFDSFSLLTLEGQMFANLLGTTAQIRGPLAIVFKADLTSVPETGENWSVSFGAKTLGGNTAIGVQFSSDGTSYANAGSVNIDSVDTRYSVNLSPDPSELGFVRFNFNAAGEVLPIIDNVAIHVPEPGAAAQLGAAALGLLLCRRCRS